MGMVLRGILQDKIRMDAGQKASLRQKFTLSSHFPVASTGDSVDTMSHGDTDSSDPF